MKRRGDAEGRVHVTGMAATRDRHTFIAMNLTGLAVTTLGLLVLTGCAAGNASSAQPGASSSPGGQPATAAGPAGATGPGANRACSGGLTGSEPGVVHVTCGGTATIHIKVAGTIKDFPGGECHAAGDVWSASAGVVIDRTGGHGAYTGPSVDSVAINNTDTPGKGTVQIVLGGRNYYALGDATLTMSVDRKTAHLTGASDHLSDGPDATIVVDVTC
jgi:hypothetical protein